VTEKRAVADISLEEGVVRSDVSKLQASIKKSGVLRPILLNSAGNLIDGARRLLAARNLGMKEIPVIVSDDYELTTKEMIATAEHGDHAIPSDHHRIWRFELATRGQMYDRINKVRRQSVSERNTLTPTRYLRGAALRVSAHNYNGSVQIMRRVYDLFDPHQAIAIKMMELMDQGKTTGVGAWQRFQREVEALSERYVRDPGTQKTVLDNALKSMLGAIRALDSINTMSPKLAYEDLDRWIRDFATVKGTLMILTRKLREVKRGDK
jgi:ParB-like nuclease domain